MLLSQAVRCKHWTRWFTSREATIISQATCVRENHCHGRKYSIPRVRRRRHPWLHLQGNLANSCCPVMLEKSGGAPVSTTPECMCADLGVHITPKFRQRRIAPEICGFSRRCADHAQRTAVDIGRLHPEHAADSCGLQTEEERLTSNSATFAF